MIISLAIIAICILGLIFVAKTIPFNRKNIEFCILVFMAALILTACWYVFSVARMMGVFA